MDEHTQYKVAGIGELLWDVLPEGKQLGGAPCNFAYHAMQAGCDATVISAIGKDPYGDEMLHKFNQLGLKDKYLQIKNDLPTGTVSVKLDDQGKPDYTIHEGVAWDHISWQSNLEALAQQLDAVCFGSLAQRNEHSRQTIRKFLESTNSECLKVFDVNLRQSFYNREGILQSLEFANVLKLNEEELPVVAEYIGYQGDAKNLLNKILMRFNLQLIAYTMGSKGSILISPQNNSFGEVPRIEIADTVGAGDAFTAILVTGLLKNIELYKIHKTATDVAAYVCTQNGATPEVPSDVLSF